jgi:hypothetical protein
MKLRSPRRAPRRRSAARTLLAGVCCALLLASVTDVDAAQPLAAAAGALAQPSAEANLLVLEVQLDGHVLSDSFTAYQDGGHVLLPLGELARLLTLAITVQPERGTASGFVIREERTFALSVNDALVTIHGRQKNFEPKLATVIGDDVYVSSKLLAHWLPIDFDVDLGRLQLRIRPREPLPLQERLAREDEAGRLRGGEPEHRAFPLQPSPYQMASVPFIDQTLATEATSGPGSHDVQSTYTLYATGDVLGFEGSAYVATNHRSTLPGASTEPQPDVRLTLARHDPDAALLGPLHARTVAFGSIVLPTVPNVTIGSPTANGLILSNRPLDQPTSFDRHTFRGPLPPGWDVTLYYNDALVGYQTPRSDGQYSFDDLPLSFGANEFRLVFNGPLGQVRVERQAFLIDGSVIAPGQVYYTLGQQHGDDGGLRTIAQADLGITRMLAATGALVQRPSLDRDGERSFGQLGLRAYLDTAILTALQTQEEGRGSLFEFNAKTRLGRYSLDFTHLQRQGQYDGDLLGVSAIGLRYRDVARLDGVLRTDGLPPLTLALQAARDALDGGRERIDLAGRVSAVVRGTAITNSLESIHSDDASSAFGALQLSRRVVDVGVSAQAGYTVSPRLSLDSLALTADRALGDAYRVTAGVQRAMSQHLTTVAAGLTKNLGRFGLGLNVSYATNHVATVGLQLFVALGREPRSGAWMVDAQPMAGTGAISARAFVDRNMNGIRDPGEELIPDAGFILNGGGRHPSRTDADGTAFIGHLTPGQYTDFELDPSTLADPQWKPASPGVRVLPRPGVVDVVEFPVVATSEIDGTVFLVANGRRRGIGDAQLELVNRDGEVVASTRSSGDGYYLLHQVMPGQYTLRIAPEQADKLRLQGTLARPLTVPVDGDFINGQDFELRRAASDAAPAGEPKRP